MMRLMVVTDDGTSFDVLDPEDGSLEGFDLSKSVARAYIADAIQSTIEEANVAQLAAQEEAGS